MRLGSGFVATVLVAGSFSMAAAQHHGHGSAHRSAMSANPVPEARQFVKFPPPIVDHTLSNMRDHLQALQEILSHLGTAQPDAAAKIAESRLGMSSLSQHGAHEVAKFMPKGMQDAGNAMHRAASRFAIAAQDAGVTGDLKPAFSGLADITAACVGCHAGYRLK